MHFRSWSIAPEPAMSLAAGGGWGTSPRDSSRVKKFAGETLRIRPSMDFEIRAISVELGRFRP
jgi:hypothetical protein